MHDANWMCFMCRNELNTFGLLFSPLAHYHFLSNSYYSERDNLKEHDKVDMNRDPTILPIHFLSFIPFPKYKRFSPGESVSFALLWIVPKISGEWFKKTIVIEFQRKFPSGLLCHLYGFEVMKYKSFIWSEHLNIFSIEQSTKWPWPAFIDKIVRATDFRGNHSTVKSSENLSKFQGKFRHWGSTNVFFYVVALTFLLISKRELFLNCVSRYVFSTK